MAKKIFEKSSSSSAVGAKAKTRTKTEDEDAGDVVSAELWWFIFLVLMAANAATRFHSLSQPAWVCWDETHFGKMGSWYINRTFFFDVHPPLGKMFIAAVGHATGYNGTFPFEKPGDPYLDHSYLGMRAACTLLGAALAPFSFLTVWELTRSLAASAMAGAFVVFGEFFKNLICNLGFESKANI